MPTSELISAAIGALLGGAVTFVVAQRRLRSENISAERTKWREKIRELALLIVQGGDETAWVKLALNTNPLDENDIALVNLARKLGSIAPSEWDRDELVGRFALLLKHDWDRAKIEASWWPFVGVARIPHSRVRYHDL